MSDPWIPYESDRPAFTVQRALYGDVTGGDYVRGSNAGLPKAAVRYAPTVAAPQDIAAESSLVAFVKSYDTVELTWGWPEQYSNWTDVSLVRSGFGHPNTVNDGVSIFTSTRDAYAAVSDDDVPLSIIITDTDLPGGRWMYYTLFFRSGGTWVPVLNASALVPRNFHHEDHLWDAIPPYYQWVDSRFRSDDGHLRRFLRTLGFELDLTREYIESWQDAYHADFSPVQLLKRVGENLGLSYESGLGEIRYRALVGQLSELYARRGTPEGIRRLIEVSSKFECDLSVGRNMMVLPDDSDFGTGQGNWAIGGGGTAVNAAGGLASATGAAFAATVITNATRAYAGLATASGVASSVLLTPQPVTATATGTAFAATVPIVVRIEAPYETDDRIEGYGRAVMRVSAPLELGTRDIIVQAGLGELFVPPMQEPRLLSPKYNGISVKEGNLYGFTVMYKSSSAASGSGVAGIYWFDRYERQISATELLTPSPGNWQSLTVQGAPPATAVFAVPYVRQSSRAAGNGFMLMGAMFYRVGDTGSVIALSPDYYLTLGNPDELIGSGGKVIGDA